MFQKTKVMIIQLFLNLILSGVFCDVSELKLSSTTENYDVTTTTNNFQNSNIDPINTQTDYLNNPAVSSRISLFGNVNETPENYQLPQDGPSSRLGISNGIIATISKEYENPNQYFYNNNGCGHQCHPGIVGNDFVRNPYYNRPIVQDRPILDATSGILGGGYQYQPNNLGTAIYTRPSYTGNLGQTIYNRPNVVEKPIYQYSGNLGQNGISQPNRCCLGGSNINEQVVSRPSGCCFNGNIGQNVVSQPSYYLNNNNNNGYIYNKPSCLPCNRDDTVEIINGNYYPKPIYPNPIIPTYIPPTYSTTPQTVFPPATARIFTG